MADTGFEHVEGRDPELRELIHRLDAQEHRVRRRAVYLTALPIIATIVCLALISIVLSCSMRQLADAERLRTNAIQAAAQAEGTRQVAEGRTLLAVQELENIGRQIEEGQNALAAFRPSTPASARALGEAAAAAGRSVKEIQSVTSALSPVPSDTSAAALASASRADLIQQLYSAQAAVRIRAYNSLMGTQARDPQLVPDLLEIGIRELKHTPFNANGIFNTLVVLSHIDRARLVPYRNEVRRFAEEAKYVGGPTTQMRADTLIQRLP